MNPVTVGDYGTADSKIQHGWAMSFENSLVAFVSSVHINVVHKQHYRAITGSTFQNYVLEIIKPLAQEVFATNN